LKLATKIATFAGINILLAFAINWYTMTTLGPGPETDALYAGLVVPNLMMAIFSGSLVNVLVPLLAVEKGFHFSQQAWNFFQLVGFFYGALAFLLLITEPAWVPLVVPGFDDATKSLTIALVQIQLISMVGGALIATLTSVYHASQKFMVIEISASVATIIGLSFLLWGLPRFGVMAAAWATVIKTFFQVLILIPGLGRYYKPDLRTKILKEACRRVRPLVLGNAYYKTGQLVDTFLASLAPSGSISLLHLARQIYTAGHQLLGKAITNPTVPVLAKMANQQEWKSYSGMTNNRIGWMLLITASAFLGIVILGKPALTLIFGHGRFDDSSLSLLWLILVTLVGFWMGGPIGQILSASFYAKGNTATPTKIGIFGFTIGIFLKLGGFYLWGIIGIAVGISLYYFLNSILLRYTLSLKLNKRISDT